MRERVRRCIRHWAGRNVEAITSGLEVEHNIVDRPAAETDAGVAGQVGRVPALQHRTLHRLAVLVASHRVLRRVTKAAMFSTASTRYAPRFHSSDLVGS